MLKIYYNVLVGQMPFITYETAFMSYVSCRLMNSPVSNVGLEGFFLRLRVGKGDEDCGHSGYRVARICGKNTALAVSKYWSATL